MLSLQNPHHLGAVATAAAAASASGPMHPRRQYPPSPSRVHQDPMASAIQLNHQRSLNTPGFKAVMCKPEKNGTEESVEDDNNDCAPRSQSLGSTSASGSFSASGERRKLKRRREEREGEEEEGEENAEDDRMDEDDGSRGSRRRMHSIWIHGKNKLEEDADNDDDDEVDDDDEEDEEEEGMEGGSEDGVIQKQILTQKPLGLLAQHGLTGRTPNSAKFHLVRRNSHEEGVEEEELEERRRNGGMREEEEEVEKEDARNGGRREKEDAEVESVGGGGGIGGGGVSRAEEPLFLRGPTESGRQRRTYSSDGDEEQVAADHSSVLLSSRGCHDIGNFASHISLMDQRFMPSPPLSASPESGQESSTPGGHHWTFEEQFKQLYELTDDPNRKLFLDDLFSFMQKRGTPVNRIPIMAKQTLDLFELFQLVVSKGGLVEVINKKLWREITKGLNLPSSITSAAFTLRTQYMKYLYPYECEKLKLSTLSELQYAVDGNRREGRRSGFGQDFSPLPPILPINPSAVAHMHDGLSGVNAAGRSAVSLSLKDRVDQQMILAPTVNQLRTLAECDAHAVKAASRAMAEVTKRMEEATRAAAASHNIRFVSGQGQGQGQGPPPPQPPSLCPQMANNLSMKTEEPTTTKRPTTLEEAAAAARFPTPLHRTNSSGVSTAHIKLTSRENGHSNHLGGSIIGSMEINGILYQGVLFAQPPPTHLLD